MCVSVIQDEKRKFSELQGTEFINPQKKIKLSINENYDSYTVDSSLLKIIVSKKNGSIIFIRNEQFIFSEASENPHVTERFDVYKTCGSIKTEEIKTADSIKKRIVNADRIYDKSLYHKT